MPAPRWPERHWRRKRGASQRGYALIALLALLGAGVIFFLVRQLEDHVGVQERQDQTSAALTQAKNALLGFAVTYRDTHPGQMLGRLPCPDLDGYGTAAVSCGTGTEAVVGFLPYKTLGLSDLRDATGACLMYAVSPGFKSAPASAVINWDLQGRFRIVGPSGNAVTEPGDAEGGAAAVIFAPGRPMALQNRSAPDTATGKRCGAISAANVEAAEYLESASFDSAGKTSAPIVEVKQASPNDATGNDRLLWVTPREIFAPIKRRNDFAADINHLVNETRIALQQGVAAPVDPIATLNKKSGTLPVVAGVVSDYFPHWQDQFRYVRCDAGSPGCLTVGNLYCSGALIFAGERSTGGPRTTAQKLDPSSFLEGPNLTGFTTAAAAFSGVNAFSTLPDPRLPASGDVVACLLPEISFARDAGNFSTVSAPLRVAGETGVQNLAHFSGGQLTLGNLAASTLATDADTGGAVAIGKLFGCAWFNTPVPIGKTVRIFFQVNVDVVGEGFTFLLADADPARNLNTSMCGDGGDALGYAGTNLVPGIAPINHPKIGLEFDSQKSVARNDPDNHHVAILFWGQDGTAVDDDVHLGPVDTGPANLKSATITCLNDFVGCPTSGDRSFLVRIEIARDYFPALHSSSYDIKAWVLQGTVPDAAFQNTDVNYVAALPTIKDTATIQDIGGGEALNFFYPGFTVGQAAQVQRIVITNFVLKSQ